MMLNRSRLLSPDGLPGKLLVFGRAAVVVARWGCRETSPRIRRIIRLVLEVTPSYTMISPERLRHLYERMLEVDALGLSGDIVECGTWNGGSGAILVAAHRDAGPTAPRRVFWLFDSFQGLPPPGARDGPSERETFFSGWCRGTPDRVRRIVGRLGGSLEDVRIVPGWFEESFPAAPIGPIALLHVDADWYDSVRLVLETFYDRIVPGGTVILDDYGRWAGCRTAADEFLARRGLSRTILLPVDRAAFFRKPSVSSP